MLVFETEEMRVYLCLSKKNTKKYNLNIYRKIRKEKWSSLSGENVHLAVVEEREKKGL